MRVKTDCAMRLSWPRARSETLSSARIVGEDQDAVAAPAPALHVLRRSE